MKKIYFIIPFLFIIMGTAAQTPDMKKEDIRELKQKIRKQEDVPKLLEKGRDGKRNIGKTNTKEWEHGDAPAWIWSEDYGGSGRDNGNDVAIDANGNYYVAGSFSGEVTYGDSSYTSSGLRDGFVAKFDNTGNLMWFSHIEANTHGRVGLKGINIDTEGNIYTTGYFSETINPGGNSLTGENEQNFLLLKLDNSGEVTFAKTYDTNISYMSGKTVQADSDGNIYALTSNSILKYGNSGSLLWEIQEDVMFNDFKLIDNSLYYVGYVHMQTGTIDTASYSMDGNQYYDLFIAKSDTEGNFSYVKLPKHTDDNNDSRAFEISTDENKNLYITANFDDIVLGEDTLSGASEQALVVKFDTTGTAKWATKLPFTGSDFPLTTSSDSITYIAHNRVAYKCDSYGNIEISDDTINSNLKALKFDDNTGSVITAGNKDGALYFSALNGSLDETENIEFTGNSASASIAGMVSDDQGNIYVLGTCNNTIDYHGETLPGGLFFAKHDAGGNLLWVKKFPKAGSYIDIGDAITIDPQNQNIFIMGDFYEEISIPGGGTLTPESDGSMFVLKYDIGGNFMWSNKVDDLSFNSADLTADYSGNVILSNSFSNTIEIGSETFTSQGSDDIITIKFSPGGNILWSLQAGGEDTEYMGITSVDENDNIYFTGEFTSQNVSIGDSSLTLNEGDGNILFAKLNSDGVVQWTTSHAGSVVENSYQDYSCWPTGIKTMPDGYSYIKGWHGDSVAFSDTILANKYGMAYNYFIGKFNPEGEAVWVNSIDEEYFGWDYNQMDVDDEGNVYFGAQVSDNIHFKHYEEEYTYAPVGESDLFVAQYTSDGDIGWIKTMESRYGNNWLSSVAVVDKNKLYAAGYYDDYISFGNSEYYSESKHGFVTKMFKNLAPTNITLSNDTIEETASVGTEVGNFSTEDPDAGDEHTYALVSGDGSNDSDNVRFDISGNTLITDAEFDYDSQQELNIYVQTKDTADNTYAKSFVIQVVEVDNQAPTNIILSSDSIEETAPIGTAVGSFSTEDTDTGDEHTYSLVSGDGTNDADNDKFEVSGNNLVTAAELNYDSQNELNINIQTEDPAGNTFEKDFVIHVIEDEGDEDEETAIRNIENSPFRVYPNPASNKLIISNSEAEEEKVRSIRIISMEGLTVYTEDSEGDRLSRINIAHIPAGVYVVEIQTAEERYHGRLIKE